MMNSPFSTYVRSRTHKKLPRQLKRLPTRPPVWRFSRARHRSRSRSTVNRGKKIEQTRRPKSRLLPEPRSVLVIWACMAIICKRRRTSTSTSLKTKWIKRDWGTKMLLKQLLCMSYKIRPPHCLLITHHHLQFSRSHRRNRQRREEPHHGTFPWLQQQGHTEHLDRQEYWRDQGWREKPTSRIRQRQVNTAKGLV